MCWMFPRDEIRVMYFLPVCFLGDDVFFSGDLIWSHVMKSMAPLGGDVNFDHTITVLSNPFTIRSHIKHTYTYIINIDTYVYIYAYLRISYKSQVQTDKSNSNPSLKDLFCLFPFIFVFFIQPGPHVYSYAKFYVISVIASPFHPHYYTKQI